MAFFKNQSNQLATDAEANAGDGAEKERILVEMGSGMTGPISVVSDRASGRSGKRRLFRRRLTYTTRVTAAFVLIAAMTALVAIGVLSFVWEQHFQTYTQENMMSLAEKTAENVGEVYEQTRTLDSPQVSAIARYSESLNSGVGVCIIDTSEGRVVYDSTLEQPGMPSADSSASTGSKKKSTILSNHSLAPFSSENQFASAAIKVGGEPVGSVRVWVYGSESLLRQTDQQFRDNSYQAMIFATAIAVVLALCIGFLFARNLVAPINRMTRTARAIKEGDLSARTNLHGEDEVSRLGETFDAMAESVENDRELERRLTTDVAHELRTPLMAIQATVEAMVDGVYEADEERLETVNGEVQRLSRLVDAILKLSRLECRSTPMREDVVNVGDLVASIVATHEAFVVDAGLKMVFEADPDVLVKGDADMIRQATANLISNAVRYTPEGTVTVKVEKGDLMASIKVQDTGIGLSPEEAKMVFSRFWRADAGRNRASGGLGIGLSVVKEIVDRHNGWVQVDGRKGEGASFTIHIPLYVPETPHEHNAITQRFAKVSKQARAPKQQRAQKSRAKSRKQKK